MFNDILHVQEIVIINNNNKKYPICYMVNMNTFRAEIQQYKDIIYEHYSTGILDVRTCSIDVCTVEQ